MTRQPSFHEQVALVMSRTWSAGTFNDYGTILSALHRRFPTEKELRRYMEQLEARMRAAGIVPDNWTFDTLIDDETAN